MSKVISDERKLDPGARWSRNLVRLSIAAVAVSGIVFVLSSSDTVALSSVPFWTALAVSTTILVLAAGLLALSEKDFNWVESSLVEFESEALPNQFAKAMAQYQSADYRAAALTFERLNAVLPRWPWGVLGWAVASDHSQDSMDLRELRLKEVYDQLTKEATTDPVDMALTVAAARLVGKSRLHDREWKLVADLASEQTDMCELSRLGLLPDMASENDCAGPESIAPTDGVREL